MPNNSFYELDYDGEAENWMRKGAETCWCGLIVSSNSIKDQCHFDYSHYEWLGVPDNVLGEQEAADNDQSYIAIVRIDLTGWKGIGIKLKDPLEKGETYNLQIFVNKPEGKFYHGYELKDNAKFKPFLSTSTSNNGPSGDEQKLNEKSIDNKENWITKKWEFEAEYDLEYLFIKLTNVSSIYVDNVKLTKCGCGTCSRTVGKIEPIAVNDGTQNARIINLSNVKKAEDLYIVNIGGRTITIPSITAVNGITEDIYLAEANDELYPGTWYLCGKFSNDCHEEKYGDLRWYEWIPIIGDWLDDPNTHEAIKFILLEDTYPFYGTTTRNYTDFEIPMECCESDIIVKDCSLYGHVPVVAKSNIKTNGNVVIKNDGENCIFQAGNNVELNSGFTVEKGAQFEIIMEKCSE